MLLAVHHRVLALHRTRLGRSILQALKKASGDFSQKRSCRFLERTIDKPGATPIMPLHASNYYSHISKRRQT